MLRRDILLGSIAGGGSTFLAIPAAAQAAAQENSVGSGNLAGGQNLPLVTLPAHTQAPAIESGTVDSAKTPLSRDEDAWANTVAKFRLNYGSLPVRFGLHPAPTASANQPVFDPKSSVSRIEYSAEDVETFLYTQADSLLNQAADLLDRASSSKNILNDRSAKATLLALDISAFLENDAIHQREIQAGIYTIPYQLSQSDLAGKISRLNGLNSYLAYNGFITGSYFSQSAIDSASAASELLSWLSFIPNYQYPYAGSALTQTFNGVALPASQHAVNNTALLSYRSAFIQLLSYNAQGGLQSGAQGMATQAVNGATVQTAWNLADIMFKRDRTQVARDLADYKVQLSTQPGGALNYSEQTAQARRRLLRDLVDGIRRSLVAEKGLHLVFGNNHEVPGLINEIVSGQTGDVDIVQALEDLNEWVRNRISELTAFVQRDQVYTVVVELPSRMSQQEWKKGLSDGTWTVDFDESFLPKQCHVRIRGINLYARSPTGYFGGEVRIPTFSFYRHLSGERVGVDQGEFGPVRLGKISSPANEKYRQWYGTTLLRNTAPFGPWTVKVDSQSTLGEPRDKLTSVELHIELTVRNMPR